MPDLIIALTDEYSDVRKEAAIALGNLENADALNALQQALDDPDRDGGYIAIQTRSFGKGDFGEDLAGNLS